LFFIKIKSLHNSFEYKIKKFLNNKKKALILLKRKEEEEEEEER
jgi:hypothetical protein